MRGYSTSLHFLKHNFPEIATHAKTAGGGEGLGVLLGVFWRNSRRWRLGQKAQAMLQVIEQMPNNVLKTVLNLLFQATL